MSVKKYYNIHDLVHVEIKGNVAKAVFEQIDFQINFFETEFKSTHQSTITVYPYEEWKNTEQKTSIYYDSNFISEKFVNNTKEKTIVTRDRNGFSIFTDTPILINLFIQFVLYPKGYSFIHAGGVVDKLGNAIIFPGPGGVGKTAILGSLVQKKGYKLLGDDVFLLHKSGTVLPFPRPFILKEYHRSVYPEVFSHLTVGKKKNTISRKVLKFLIRNAPFYHAASEWLKENGLYSRVLQSLPLHQDYVAAVPVTDIFGSDCIAEGVVEVAAAYYLERVNSDDFSVSPIDSRLLSDRMFSVIHDEWSENAREILRYGATNLISLPDYYKVTAESIDSALAAVDNKLISIPKSATPEALYQFYIDIEKKYESQK